MSGSGGGAALAWRRFRRTVAPSATYVLITITLLVFFAQLLPGSGVTEALLYSPAYSIPATGTPFEPWRMITVGFVHSTGVILHIGFNMLALWMFGQPLEAMIGKWRFLAIYFLSTLGGSIAVLYLVSPFQGVVGASGAIFGLLGAFFVIARNSGSNTTGLVVMIALNLGIGLFFRTISWQAHIGGLVAGALVALIFVRTPRRNQRNLQMGLLIALTAVLLLISFWPAISGTIP